MSVGDGKGNVLGLVFLIVEHRPDEWCVRFNVGRHYHHFVRGEVVECLEQMQQLIVQYFHLTQRAVAGMDLQRIIHRRLAPRARRQIHRVNVRL
jgi:hypothetical protein